MNLKSGILLPASSLPGQYGLGEIGKQARQFIKTLKSLGQSSWQILPLGPTGYGNSPYQSLSTFAANELLICFDDLIEQGLLSGNDAQTAQGNNPNFIDYSTCIAKRQSIVDLVAGEFSQRASQDMLDKYNHFCEIQSHWLDNYALFRVLKNSNDQLPWYQWPIEYRDRKFQALTTITDSYQLELERIKIGQFLFFSQWQHLRQTAKNNGIELIGDLPIFIAHDSVEAWCERDLFLFDKDGQCSVIAGVPPDYFSEEGQRWGNPLYHWDNHRAGQYQWWFKRLDHAQSMVDIVRIDHFRGFQAYWEIPAENDNAIIGKWVEAPGEELFSRYLKHRSGVNFIAENLGVITPLVEQLRNQFSFPGMHVLQFGFDNDPENTHLPQNYHPNSVAYTSTHDNDTLAGWLDTNADIDIISETIHISKDEISCAQLIKKVMQSQAKRVIFPAQDILELDSSCRMNTPSTTESNWQWRITNEQLTDRKFEHFKQTTIETNR